MTDNEKFIAGMVQIKVCLMNGETKTRWVTPKGPDLSEGVRAELKWNETLVGMDTGQR